LILAHYDVDVSRVTTEVTRTLDRLKRGNAKDPNLSADLAEWMSDAWLLASVEFEGGLIRSGHLLLALLGNRNLAAGLRDVSAELARIRPDALRNDLAKLTARSREATAPAAPGQPAAARPGGPTKTPSLDQFTQDLTARAREGKLDPVIG